MFDPFITTHLVNENSNVGINAVAEIFKQIARDGACAVCLLVHLAQAECSLPVSSPSMTPAAPRR